jgi:recombination protein RecA
MPEKNTELDVLLKEVNRILEQDEQFFLASKQPEGTTVRVIPTGSFSLDIALGIGGWPVGCFNELYGQESVGKSFLALMSIKEAQKLFPDKFALYIDAEQSLNPQLAQQLGVNLDRLLISRTNSARKAFGSLTKWLESGAVSFVVVDSIASLITENEEDEQENVEKAQVGSLARVMNQVARKLTALVARSGATVLLLNQIREKINMGYGSSDVTTPGGHALLHSVSTRVFLNFASSTNTINDKPVFVPRQSKPFYYNAQGKVIGARIHAVVKKNKKGPSLGQAFYDAYWQKGIDRAGEIIDLGVFYELLGLHNGWYSYKGQKFAHGRENAIKKLQDDPEFAAELESQIKEIAGIINKED